MRADESPAHALAQVEQLTCLAVEVHRPIQSPNNHGKVVQTIKLIYPPIRSIHFTPPWCCELRICRTQQIACSQRQEAGGPLVLWMLAYYRRIRWVRRTQHVDMQNSGHK